MTAQLLLGRDDEVINAVTRLVEASPEFVYESPVETACVYVFDGAPSCLVGQAFAAVGVPLDTLEDFDINDDSGLFASTSASTVADNLGLTERTAFFLEAVQQRQDVQAPWKDALAHGIEVDAEYDQQGEDVEIEVPELL
jgi:hypothetical protein